MSNHICYALHSYSQAVVLLIFTDVYVRVAYCVKSPIVGKLHAYSES